MRASYTEKKKIPTDANESDRLKAFFLSTSCVESTCEVGNCAVRSDCQALTDIVRALLQPSPLAKRVVVTRHGATL